MTTLSVRYPQRVRNELRFRGLTVLLVERIRAGFQRIILGSKTTVLHPGVLTIRRKSFFLSQAAALCPR